MTIEKQTHYLGGRFSTKRKVLETGTTFRLEMELSDGDTLVKTLCASDPDTLIYTIDPDDGNESREIMGDTINHTWFPPTEKLSFLDRLIGKDTRFYWYPAGGYDMQIGLAKENNPTKHLLWEQKSVLGQKLDTM